MKSFLKWPGGKRWLVSDLGRAIGQIEGRFIEPFLGGAALFFHLEPKSSILSDANANLINTYLTIANSPTQLVSLLEKYQCLHSKDFYYEERAQRHSSKERQAAQFLYLNRTCFNGIYRVNLRGEFNVPIGSKMAVVMSDDNFEFVSKLLGSAIIQCCDFEETINQAISGDVIFADPPYTVKHNMNGFIKYNETLFAWSDQIRLCKALERAASRGARVFSTNANHASLTELYGANWHKYELSRRSVIAGKSAARSQTTELLVCSEALSEQNFREIKPTENSINSPISDKITKYHQQD